MKLEDIKYIKHEVVGYQHALEISAVFGIGEEM